MENEKNTEIDKNKVSSLNVLYVEDEESFCQLAKQLFSDYGCQLEFAKNGFGAVDKFKSKEYDLLFVDNSMPDIDSFTVVKELRSFESEHRDKQTVIIMVSADDAAGNLEENFDVGYDGYLIKPIKKGDLQDIFDFLTEDNSEDTDVKEESADSDEKIVVKVDKDIENIVPEYLENIITGSKKIPDALARSDFEFIYRYGHNMKGTGTSYGFTAISEIGRVLEQAGTDKDVQVINKEVAKLTDYINKVHIVYE